MVVSMVNQFTVRSLQLENKKLQSRILELESGSFAVSLREKHKLSLSKLNNKIALFKSKQTKLTLNIDIKNNKIMELNNIIDNLELNLSNKFKENQKLLRDIKKLTNENEKLRNKKINSKIKEENESLKQTVNKQEKEIEQLKALISSFEIETKTLKIKSTKNSTNSSKPSSTDGFNKKKQNNRDKSDKKSGGQTGHEGHCAVLADKVDEVINCFLDSSFPNFELYELTDEYKIKQEIDILIQRYVKEYREYKYVNKVTGECIYAKNIEGINSRVVYGSTLKTVALLLNDYGNVSVDKTNALITLLTNNQIRLSNATIQNFKKEFNFKVEEDYNKLVSDLLMQDHLCIDHTSIDVLGKLKNILFMGNEKVKVYAAVETKGTNDIKPYLEEYSKTLVHDHAAAFRNFGIKHQECLAHISRNLKGIFENLKYNWAYEMRTFLQSLIENRKRYKEKGKQSFSKTYLENIQRTFNRICKKGKRELLDIKENKYNKEGFNMLRMLIMYKDNILLFTEDFNIPHTSNLAERALRISKTKMKISGQFYSLDNAKMYAKLLTIIETLKTRNHNILEGIKNIFTQKSLKLT